MVYKKGQNQKKMTPREYIRYKVRSLPIGDCYMSNDWKDVGEAMIMVTRIHPQCTYTLGFYVVDTYCLGVKDSFFHFSIDKFQYEEILNDIKSRMMKVSYEEVHNLVYGAVAFAEEGGIQPDESFKLTQYILEEDTDEVPLIEYDFGRNGKYFLCANDRIELSKYAPVLKKAVGDDFFYLLPGMKEAKPGSEYIDLSFMDNMMSALEKMKKRSELPEEVYSFVHPEYPAELNVKHKWLAEMLYSPEKSVYLTDDDLSRILALPHDELRDDLENIVLYETGQTYGGISEERWNGGYKSVILHCMLLLGELGDEASLPTVLLTLCQNADYYDYHFGDSLSDVYVPTLYMIGKNRLDDFMAYMKMPGLYPYARIRVSETVVTIALKEPERRDEVIEWFRELLMFYDGRQEKCECCDGTLIGLMTGDLMNLKAVELLPELKKLYDTGLVDEMCCGNFKTVVKEIKGDKEPLLHEYSFDIHERYQKLKRLLKD